MEGLLGRKVGMTQVFEPTGVVVPVTAIELGPCFVTQVKTLERDGYEAIQIGFGAAKKLNKPKAGHLMDRSDPRHPKSLPSLRYLREIRPADPAQYTVGQQLDVSIFAPGDFVDVVGTSKGKGYQGGVKRHHFRGGPRTHGQSDRHRAPGSVGAGTTPGRVLKGTRMAGRMGHERVTVQNLRVVLADPERNLLLVRGAVPGSRNGLLIVRRAIKRGKEGRK